MILLTFLQNAVAAQGGDGGFIQAQALAQHRVGVLAQHRRRTPQVTGAVAEVAAAGTSGPSAMGAVMKIVSPQVSGRADGGAVAAAVKSALA